MDQSFELTGFDHVQLAIPPGGEDEARRFYVETLGLAEAPKPPHLAARGGCWFDGPGLRLHLGVEADFRPARKAHPALRVRGLPALRRRLQGAGYVTREDEPLEGYDRFYVDDPFGNRIELMEPVSG
ncbi:MAG TPA: glyoxalase [Caulobacteraceae bacterium]|jgi:catechol 2,3-dioxygenase-like lactoylglutathione lyase family enzyme